jgi:AraC-like DNA-binding protein
MIIPLEKFGESEFSVTGVNLIHQKPTYRYLNVKKRHCNGFLFFIKGECVYEYADKKITFTPGSAVYLPYGSKHTLKVVSEDIEFFRVDFTIKQSGEVVLFSNHLIKVIDSFGKGCVAILDELKSLCLYSNDELSKIEKLLGLLAYLKNKNQVKNKSKIYPACVYIQEHFAEPINCAELARLCFLSTSQFYNLFAKQLGCSPLQYRDNIIVEKAKVLLQLEEITVSEISEVLGFTDVAYFSRFFKKHVGISPSDYAREER